MKLAFINKKSGGIALVVIGVWDLVAGSSTPVPLIGNYLTEGVDLVLIAGGLALVFIG